MAAFGDQVLPADDQIETLAGRLLTRIEAVLTDGGPGLSTRALRLSGASVASSSDAYLLLDGEADCGRSAKCCHDGRCCARDEACCVDRCCPAPANGIAGCDEGVCTVACKRGFQNCDGVCCDAVGQRCGAGVCIDNCQPGSQQCGFRCCAEGRACCNDVCCEVGQGCAVNSCAACVPGADCCDNTECGEGKVCQDGRCACPATTADCDGDGVCQDLTFDAANCGGCGRICGADRRCRFGRCCVEDGRPCPAGCAPFQDCPKCCTGVCDDGHCRIIG